MTKKEQRLPNPVIAVVLACAVPGAGHIYLGRARRGIILFLILTGLFWTGVGIGGVMTVDSRNEWWWFMAQALTGVNGLVAWQRAELVVREVDAAPDKDTIRATLSSPRTLPLERENQIKKQVLKLQLANRGLLPVNPTDTVARAYSGVAGLMNLMCIFDVILMSVMGIRGESGREAKPKRRPDEDKRSAA